MTYLPKVFLSKESRKILLSAEDFRAKTGKDRIALLSKDFNRLIREYAPIKKPVDGALTINGIQFYDGIKE